MGRRILRHQTWNYRNTVLFLTIGTHTRTRCYVYTNATYVYAGLVQVIGYPEVYTEQNYRCFEFFFLPYQENRLVGNPPEPGNPPLEEIAELQEDGGEEEEAGEEEVFDDIFREFSISLEKQVSSASSDESQISQILEHQIHLYSHYPPFSNYLSFIHTRAQVYVCPCMYMLI